MSAKTISIAGPRGLRIPASVLGKAAPGAEDVMVPPHEPIDVPEAYGRSLIADRFAVEAPAPAKSAGKPAKGDGKSEAEKELDKLTKDELLAKAAEANVAATAEMTKAEIIALLVK
ncbi:hypothetical protein ACD578_05365 [Microvirga sp. RSM25]|uniref:hypothetical protein n=1 Tax=Microvirga sp. RSM25 TaxID=3273802 RepID=UPI00384A6B08